MAFPAWLLPVLFTAGGAAAGAATRPRSNPQRDIQELLNVPEIRRMLELQTRQAERSDPLHQAIIRLAGSLLPASAGFVDTMPEQPSGPPREPRVRQRRADRPMY